MGKPVTDFIEDTDGDIAIKDGDLAIGLSDDLHIKDTMVSAPGWWVQFALIGFNPARFFNSKNSQQTIKNEAIKQLTMVGYTDISFPVDITIESNGAIGGQIVAKRK